MFKEVVFPGDDRELQKWHLVVKGRGTELMQMDVALATAVLLTPATERNSRNQQILVLAGSVIRASEGHSHQARAAEARGRLLASGAIEDFMAGKMWRLTKHVAFPVVSRAADFINGRGVNGYEA